jgi:hypothetical protein
LGVYIDDIHVWQDADDSSPWYLRSSNFTIELPKFPQTTDTYPSPASATTTLGSYPTGTVTGGVAETSAAKSSGAAISAISVTGFRGTLLALSVVGLVAEVFLGC